MNIFNGLIIINKPSGITSHDVVDFARRKFNMKKVGHAGTLDPLATGLLIILLGKFTKFFDKFSSYDKTYNATLILGTCTTSSDTEGEIIGKRPYEHITENQINDVLGSFIGDIEQIPPMYSAVKYKGKKLYELARKGIDIERKAKKIRVNKLKIINFDLPNIKLEIECSKGTYIRQLAADIGEKLACGACISQIERTQIGPYKLSDSVELKDLNESHIRDWKS